MPKSYAYLDESGLARNALFVVALIIPANSANARQTLQKLEASTGKQQKWAKSRDDILIPFIQQLLAAKEFIGVSSSVIYTSGGDHYPRIVRAIAETLKSQTAPEKMCIQVDGLPKAKRNQIANEVRALGVKIGDIRGATDENEPLIRAADAIAGLTRDALLGKQPFDRIFQQAIQTNCIRRIDLK